MAPRSAAWRIRPGSPFDVPKPPAPPPDVFELEDRVTHDRYGLGRVVGTEGASEVTVNFGSCVLRFVLPHAKLSKL